MKYTLFVSCEDHANVLKDFFADYTFVERKEGELTVLTFKDITLEEDKEFFKMFKESLTCRKNGIKVQGLRLPA